MVGGAIYWLVVLTSSITDSYSPKQVHPPAFGRAELVNDNTLHRCTHSTVHVTTAIVSHAKLQPNSSLFRQSALLPTSSVTVYYCWASHMLIPQSYITLLTHNYCSTQLKAKMTTNQPKSLNRKTRNKMQSHTDIHTQHILQHLCTTATHTPRSFLFQVATVAQGFVDESTTRSSPSEHARTSLPLDGRARAWSTATPTGRSAVVMTHPLTGDTILTVESSQVATSLWGN